MVTSNDAHDSGRTDQHGEAQLGNATPTTQPPEAPEDVWSFLSPQTGSSVFPGSAVGLLINRLSNGRFLAFPEQQPSFDLAALPLQTRRLSETATAISAVNDPEKGVGFQPSQPSAPTTNSVKRIEVPALDANLGRSQSLQATDTKRTLIDPSTPSLHAPVKDFGPIYLPSGGGEGDGEAVDEKQDAAKLQRFPTSFVPVSTLDQPALTRDDQPPASTIAPNQDKIVGWYSSEDLENPQNWPRAKKLKLTACLMLLTFTVYISSAVYSASAPTIEKIYHLTNVQTQFGISAFILGYATGPLFICPLADFPFIGKNGVYIPSTVLFTVFSILAALGDSYPAIMLGRFWSGFFGSPALSLAAASLSDVWNPGQLAYAMAVWSVGAVGGPTLGPLVGGYSAMCVNYRLPLMMVFISGAATTVSLCCFLPESSAETILYRRAKRLRQSTGDVTYRAQSEIDASKIQPGRLIVRILTRPFVLCVDPAALYCHLLLGIGYGCFWLDFESFPLVFQDMYGFNLGELGLPFIGLLVTLAIALVGYVWYLKAIAEPRLMRTGKITPEERLEVALVATFLIPISLVIYGWSARPNLSYWGPIIGASLVLPGIFLLYQSLFLYLPLSYAASGDAPSIMASNTFFRSVIAAAFPLFGRAYYVKLGLGIGSTILACIYLALIPFLFILWRWGDKVRAVSKYATKN